MQNPTLIFETEVWQTGGSACGIDEVGRGCLAGPVVAAAVVFPEGHQMIEMVRDSKTLTPKSREKLFHLILDSASDFGVGLVTARVIDEIGINPATAEAMTEAISMLGSDPGMLLIDAVTLNTPIPQKAIIKGDAKCYSISAASIVAKVFRDAVVSGLDSDYPEYGFSGHKGYGAASHFEAINKYGLTPEHRRSFLKKYNERTADIQS